MSGTNSKKLNKKFIYDNEKENEQTTDQSGFKCVVSENEPENIKVSDWWCEVINEKQ